MSINRLTYTYLGSGINSPRHDPEKDFDDFDYYYADYVDLILEKYEIKVSHDFKSEYENKYIDKKL
jgi:hypothetical protein